MKKLLLVIISVFITLTTTAANLNPFAYGLSSSYDPSTFTLTVNYSLNAPATKVELVIVNSDGADVGKIALPNKSKGTFTAIDVDLSTLGLTGGTYSWRLDVKCDSRSASYEPIGRMKKLNSPFSVDVDNNTESPFFGNIYVTQPTTNATRGVYTYSPQWGTAIGIHLGSGITAGSGSWYSNTHGVPYRVRVVQDGTGRLLITNCDRDISTHLWMVDPAKNMTSWTAVITSANLRDWTGHNNNNNNFANTSLDIRKSDDGKNWELLLYSATVSSSSTNFSAGYVYSGIYTVPITTTDFKGGTYKNLTKATLTNGDYIQDATISGKWTGSMITANAQFDKFGGVLYASYSTGTNPTSPSLIHRTKNGTYKKDYADGDYLTRENVATAGIRFNRDYSRLAIAQGSYASEARFYTVTQADASSNIALSERKASDMISSTIDTGSDKSYVIDFAWDYASNIYAVVRNSTYEVYGVYAMAANLGGKAIGTPAPAGNTFEVECPNRTWAIHVSGQVQGQTINQNLGECKLKVDDVDAAWNTNITKQACTLVKVTAVKDDKHKFLGWYDGDTRLSKEGTYSFYAVKDLNLVAKFEFAEYIGMKWYNLFKDGEDICSPTHDGKKNARLWYLFMPYYNKHCKNNSITQRELAKILSEDNNNYDISTFCSTETHEVLTNPNQMKWLGDYFKSYISDVSWQNVDYNRCMFAFINRVNYAKNSGGGYQYKDNDTYQSNGLITQLKVFSSTGTTKAADTATWRPYWTKHACNLPDKLKYNDPMPVTWNMIEGPNGKTYDTYTTTLPTTTGLKLINTPKWYKWNNLDNGKTEDTDFILSWRWKYNGEDRGIVHSVPMDNAELYATYVKKHLHENDPRDEASNEDIIKLMQNIRYDTLQNPSTYATATHAFAVTRKLTGGMYNTICLPFDADVSSGKLVGYSGTEYNATFYELDTEKELSSLYNTEGEDVTVIHFNPTTTLVAGVPYLVLPTTDITEDIKFTALRTSLTLTPGTTQTKDKKITFHGTINPTDISAGTLILVANNRLAMNNEHQGTMAGMRGYFTIEGEDVAAIDDLNEQARSGRIYLSMSKPVTTSVPLAPEAEQPKKPAVRKIMRDGKIYILRGDEVYTITGARVR